MTNVSEPAALGGPSARRGGRRRLVFILLAIIAVIAVVLGGGALAYAKQFEGRALPGTTILGQDVAGQTPEEIAALVSDRAESVTVSVTAGDEEHEVSLADLGVTVDAAASGQAAVADRKSTRLNSSHVAISYAVFCLKKKTKQNIILIVELTQ